MGLYTITTPYGIRPYAAQIREGLLPPLLSDSFSSGSFTRPSDLLARVVRTGFEPVRTYVARSLAVLSLAVR